MSQFSDVDTVIIGAGAAGIGAARTLQAEGRSFALIEASHRIGGRGYTEEILPGVPFDLGCHWFHSASINPLVPFAKEYGISYTNEGYERNSFRDGKWSDNSDRDEWSQFYVAQDKALEAALDSDEDVSVYDVTEREHKYTSFYDYIMSLHTSFDPDQVSVRDLMNYNDTDENWPIREGYGTLLTRMGADLPVSLNSAVTEINWSGTPIVVKTVKGDIRAKKIIITVSTGILAAGDIKFVPELPDWKLEAIHKLPLGNHNRIALAFDRDVFDPDAVQGAMIDTPGTEPLSIRFKPFDYPYAVGVTGGRFGDWLESAGQAAAVDFMSEKMKAAFGSDITRHVCAHIVTAWRGDPWVKGAYSTALPGAAGQRSQLRQTLDERVLFAGEATSPDFYSTAHGAYLSGLAAAEEAR